MKTKNLLLLICLQFLLLAGCVDYQSIVDSQEEQETGIKQESQLGDINNDGKMEKLTVNGSVIRILSESKILAEFEPNKNIEYLYVSGVVMDMDNDNINEILVYAATESESTSIIFASIYLIDMDQQQDFYMREFPEELSTIYSTSGIDAEIRVKDKFLYEIECKGNKILVDASRVYGLSTLTVEKQEKLDEEWKKIIDNNHKGEVLGIVKSEIVMQQNGSRGIRVYELVRGADKKDIGYIIFTISFDATGKYYIDDIDFMERTDVQP